MTALIAIIAMCEDIFSPFSSKEASRLLALSSALIPLPNLSLALCGTACLSKSLLSQGLDLALLK